MGKKSKLPYIVGGIVAIVVVALLILFLSGKGINISYFYTTYEKPLVELDPVSPDSAYWLNLKINPSVICMGESTTATISSNMPNVPCSIGYNIGSGWKLYKNIYLDSYGRYTESGTLNTPGTAIFRVICMDSEQRLKVSNEATLTVNDCYYCCRAMGIDSCYKNGCTPNGILISGPYDTFSKCQVNCGQQQQPTGLWLCCRSLSGTSGDCYQNDCPSGWTEMNEYSTENDCLKNCPASFMMPCSSISPAVPENCNSGFCDSGTCTFVPATLIYRARCECQTGLCNVGTEECAGRCVNLCGSPISQCGGGNCPIGWRSIVGESSCSANQNCDRCCCQCPG